MRAETPFEPVGDLIGVDAVIVGPIDRAQVQLILDTGAVMTTVVPIASLGAKRLARAVR